MNLKHIGASVAVLILLLLLSSCGKAQPVPTGFPVTYGGVVFEKTPQRVVSMSPGVTESLYILGYGGRVVGVGDYCDRPSATASLPHCGDTLEPDLEAIYELKPSLLITGVQLTADALLALDEMGIPVVTLPYAQDINEVLENQYEILRIFAGDIKAPALIEQVAFYADVRTEYINGSVERYLRSSGQTPSAVYIAREDFVLATGDTLEGKFIEAMGLANQAGAYTGWSYPPAEEPSLNPDIIFYGGGVDPESLAQNPYYTRTGAVVNERVYAVDERSFERRSMMIFDEMAHMAEEAFPDAFIEPMPALSPPIPEEPEPEPKWYDFILNWLK